MTISWPYFIAVPDAMHSNEWLRGKSALGLTGVSLWTPSCNACILGTDKRMPGARAMLLIKNARSQLHTFRKLLTSFIHFCDQTFFAIWPCCIPFIWVVFRPTKINQKKESSTFCCTLTQLNEIIAPLCSSFLLSTFLLRPAKCHSVATMFAKMSLEETALCQKC